MEGVVKMDNNYLVDIQHERLSFFTPAGEVKALNDVSIHLKEGEVLGICLLYTSPSPRDRG